MRNIWKSEAELQSLTGVESISLARRNDSSNCEIKCEILLRLSLLIRVMLNRARVMSERPLRVFPGFIYSVMDSLVFALSETGPDQRNGHP